jgi:hypothetical protein
MTDFATTFQDLFRCLFAIKVRLNADEMFSSGNSTLAPGTITVQKGRVAVNFVMFVLTAAILFYLILVTVSLYWLRRPYIPAYISTSFATMYALSYASNARIPCRDGSSPDERARNLEGTYAYGEFIGIRGRKHVGVCIGRVRQTKSDGCGL